MVCQVIAKGHSVNVTLVFTVAQYILATKAGAEFISPFVGRWEDQSVDGLGLIAKMSALEGPSNVLAASIRDVRQLEACALAGADVVTIPPKVFWKMYDSILTRQGLDLFQADWDAAKKGE